MRGTLGSLRHKNYLYVDMTWTENSRVWLFFRAVDRYEDHQVGAAVRALAGSIRPPSTLVFVSQPQG